MHWWEQLDGPILGRYRIERLLGEGGMARVFLATDVRADRPVAFKTPKIESFPPDSVQELLSRFNREFRSQASDPIQGVIPIYESGEFTDQGGVVRPFLAMQYLSGGSLGDLLGGDIGRRAHRQTLAEVLDWLVPIARTVDRLHARKYLHRDIKPDNIMFNSDGDPFLADLGIVGSLDSTLAGSTMASTSMGPLGSPGSPGYQSPESIQADPARRNVTASDQFSLAVTVYEALAGCLPVNAGTNQEWYGALMHWSPTPLSTPCPDLPSAASSAVMKAMSTQASGRFTTCSEFAKALAVSAEAPRVAPAAAAPPPLPPRVAAPAASAAPAQATASRKPMSLLNKARIAAAIFAAVVLTIGLSRGWAGPDPFDLNDADGSTSDGALDSTGPGTAENGPIGPGVGAPATAAPLWTVNFDFDKSTLGPEEMSKLDEALVFLTQNPAARLSLIGHADPTEGSPAFAVGISQRRAMGVLEALASRGVDEGRMETAAMGSSQPLAPSTGADGSLDTDAVRRNRRVELRVMQAPPAPGAVAAQPSTADAPAPDAAMTASNTPDPPKTPVETGPMTFALAKSRGVDCRDFDLDHDSVADCWDKCQAPLKPTDYVDDTGCPRRFSPTFRVIAFGARDARLDAASKAALDVAVRDLVKDNRLRLKILGRADQSEGTTAQNSTLSERRARSAFDYLVSKGVPAARLEVIGEGHLSSVGSARDPRVIATHRIVVLHGERGAEQPIPIVPLDASQVPKLQATQQPPAQWTVCRAEAESADSKTLFYAITEPMDVAPIPDWQDRIRNEGPHRPMLRAAGATQVQDAAVICTGLLPTESQARASDTRRTVKFLEEEGKDFVLKRVEGSWRIRGAGTP